MGILPQNLPLLGAFPKLGEGSKRVRKGVEEMERKGEGSEE